MSDNLSNEEVENVKQDASQQNESPEAEVTELEEKSKEKAEEKEQEDFKKKFYYLAAEMDNMKKRFDRERENLVKYGNEKVLTGLIEVVDNFERTIDALAEDKDEKIVNIVKGVQMVKDQMTEVLKKNGLKEVNAAGEIFDPNFHEAMAQQPSDDKKDQEVVSVFQKGYTLNGRLLRAAKVVVAKNENE